MKIFLAGLDSLPFKRAIDLIDYKYGLFSYFHISKNKETMDEIANSPMELICDSGLFTLMFGAGKGGTYDLDFMRDYTKRYIEWCKTVRAPNITFVESDVHKLLGMEAVFELRKYFEDSGLNHMYVWHREEGLEGLYALANKYDYIALSVPELRILFKAHDWRYQEGVFDLLAKIKANVKKMPKIHLLGNTVIETMSTELAYSCDSTSWLSGGRYGRCIVLHNERLQSIARTDPKYQRQVEKMNLLFPQLYEQLGSADARRDYYMANVISAYAFKRYQSILDKHYPWIGLKEQKNGTESKYDDGARREVATKPLESQSAV